MKKLFEVIRVLGLKGGMLLVLYKILYNKLQSFKSTLGILEWSKSHQAKLEDESGLLALQGLPQFPSQLIRFRPYTSDPLVVRQHFFGQELLPVVNYFHSKGTVPRQMIDAGGNIGVAAAYMQAYFPELQVLLIEPSEKNCKVAEKNVVSTKSEIWQKALWWREEILHLDQNRPAWGMKVSVKKNSERGEVQGISLSEILLNPRFQTIDYIKIDIEGAEEEVFAKDKSLEELVLGIACISVEPHSESGGILLAQKLTEWGYRLEYHGELIFGFR